MDNDTNSTEFFFNHTLSGVELIQLYYTPILVYLGCLGNGISMYVFFGTKLRKLSSSYYLATLAVSDNLFLVSTFVVWLRMVGLDLYNRQGVCQVINYVTGVCSFLSVWLVLAFTVERFVAVRYPLLRQSVCTVARAKLAITVLVVVSLVVYSPQMFASTITNINGNDSCNVHPEWRQTVNVFNYVDTVLTLLIPVVVITILNVCISRTVWKLASIRRRLTHRAPAGGMHMRKMPQAQVGGRQRKHCTVSQNKVTKMLLVVSTVCLCLHFPSYVMRVIADLIEVWVLDVVMLFDVFLKGN